MGGSSTFLSPGPVTLEHDLASLHLRRDLSVPVVLSTQVTNPEDEGYAEGKVTNTRFGSFPHSTMIGVPWGSQIRASKVDTGSRGRGVKVNPKKRKAGEETPPRPPPIEAAESGFVHILPPTPENWTTSLPHRTQVVYTPDYSYVLNRLRARPGSRLIEAGSGSGSFTHAAARAVFNGYPPTKDTYGSPPGDEETYGKVFSYEFHGERHKKVRAEMVEHGLDGIVHTMHRDVYKDGFLIEVDQDQETGTQNSGTGTGTSTSTGGEGTGGTDGQKESGLKWKSPRANAIFLDLPAPWEALPHLTRKGLSALDPNETVHICTFSPCIEQVQKTVSCLRQHDWLDIEMVEIQHKRIEVRREFTGLSYEGMRGANAYAVDVDEALNKLREVERRAKEFHAGTLAYKNDRKENGSGSRQQESQQQQQQQRKKLPFNGGSLVHRTEPELKTHTSYLVFAVLPREWTEEDEKAAQAKWSQNVRVASNVPKSQRQLKKEAKMKSRDQEQKRDGAENGIKATETEIGAEAETATAAVDVDAMEDVVKEASADA
ncbi:tRNA (adenine(58)-N(1))-methyltransferase catalytic subunit trm61 [Exophiala dermatitidis]